MIMKLIDKSAVVAEIERRIEINNTCQKISGGNEFYRGAIDEAKEILSFLDTLEVKEVDEYKEMMRECPYRQVGCAMYEDKILECRGACGWVADHLKLKKLKAHKGE